MPYRFWVALAAPALAVAQALPPATETRLTNLEAAVKSAQSAGDNAWMLVSAALVLMMTGPGLALFYGGLVRRKNVLSTMMHSFVADGRGQHRVGRCRLQPGVRRRERLYRRSAVPVPEWSGRRSECRLCGNHSAADLHDLPADVRHHYAGADLGRLCRAHEIQRHAAVYCRCGC